MQIVCQFRRPRMKGLTWYGLCIPMQRAGQRGGMQEKGQAESGTFIEGMQGMCQVYRGFTIFEWSFK